MCKIYKNITYMHIECMLLRPRSKLTIDIYTPETNIEGVTIDNIDEIIFKDNIKIEGMQRITRVSTIKLHRLPTTITFDIYPDKPIKVTVHENTAYISYSD